MCTSTCTPTSSSSRGSHASSLDHVSSRFRSMLLRQEERRVMDTARSMATNTTTTSLSPLQQQMLGVLSRRLHYQQASIAPMWRLITGSLSRYIVYTSSDPSQALDEALSQVKTLLQKNQANKQQSSTNSSSAGSNQRQVLLQRTLQPHKDRVNAFLRQTNLIRQAVINNCKDDAAVVSEECTTLRAKLARDTNLLSQDNSNDGMIAPHNVPTVRRILFDNELVRLMNTATIVEIIKIDWSGLVMEAEADLLAFHAWVKLQGIQRRRTSGLVNSAAAA